MAVRSLRKTPMSEENVTGKPPKIEWGKTDGFHGKKKTMVSGFRFFPTKLD